MKSSTARAEWWREMRVEDHGQGSPAMEAGGGGLRLSFGLLVAFVLVTILAPQDHFAFLKPMHLALLTGGLASVTYLFSRISGTGERVGASPAIRAAVLLFLWALVTVPLAVWPGGSFAVVSDALIKSLIVFWLLSRVVNSVPKLEMMAWTLSLIALPLSISAISAFVHGGVGNVDMMHGWERIAGYRSGLTANPNDLALMINLTLPFTIGLLLASRKLMPRVVLVSITLLDIVAVVATYSRGGFLTLATILVAYVACLSSRARKGLLLVMLAIGLAGIPLVPSGYWSRLSTITNIDSDRTDSAQQRWDDMVIASRFVATHPLIGAGAGLDYLVLNRHNGARWKHVHNVYLEYAVDLGLPGLLLFLLMYFRVLKGARVGRRSRTAGPGSELLYHLSTAAMIAVIAFGVSAMFHPVAYEFYFFYIAGLAVAAGNIARRRMARSNAGSMGR